RERQIKGVVADPFQVARISFLEFQSVQTLLRSPPVSGVDEVLRNVDSHDFGPETGERERRGAISAADIEDPHRRRDPESLHKYLSRLTHECCDLGEVTLFPQRFVRIHPCLLRRYGSQAREQSRRSALAPTGNPETRCRPPQAWFLHRSGRRIAIAGTFKPPGFIRQSNGPALTGARTTIHSETSRSCASGPTPCYAGGQCSTANRRHSPGTPLSAQGPRSANRIPEPATRSFTVLDTSSSSALASPATLAPM